MQTNALSFSILLKSSHHSNSNSYLTKSAEPVLIFLSLHHLWVLELPTGLIQVSHFTFTWQSWQQALGTCIPKMPLLWQALATGRIARKTWEYKWNLLRAALQEWMASVCVHFFVLQIPVLPTSCRVVCSHAHTHTAIPQFAALWFSLEDMLTVWGKKPQRSHPVDCGDVAGWARGVTNLRRKWHVLIASREAQNIPMTLSSCHSSLHSSSFHFYSSSAWYFGCSFRPLSSWKHT